MPGAASYAVYRSLFTGGGYQRVGTHLGDDVRRQRPPERDGAVLRRPGARRAPATRAIRRTRCGRFRTSRSTGRTCSGLRRGRYTLSVNGGLTVYGQVYIAGATEAAGQTPSLDAQLGYGPAGSDPHATSWTWQDAGFNGDVGQQRRVRRDDQPAAGGELRLRLPLLDDGRSRLGLRRPRRVPNGYSPAQAGQADRRPERRHDSGARPDGPARRLVRPGVDLARLGSGHGARPLRLRGAPGRCRRRGPYAVLDLTAAHTYTDATVAQGHTYTYVIRSVDTSWNRSANSAAGDADGGRAGRCRSRSPSPCRPRRTRPDGPCTSRARSRRSAASTGTRPRATMTRVDATHWSMTLTGKEGTQVQYKYVLGDWNYVEKGPVARLRRARQPRDDADVRLERDADGVRHRRQLAQRRALRELEGRASSAPRERPGRGRASLRPCRAARARRPPPAARSRP